LRRMHHLHSRENHPIGRSPQNFDGRAGADVSEIRRFSDEVVAKRAHVPLCQRF
jgi:hypothetical protein